MHAVRSRRVLRPLAVAAGVGLILGATAVPAAASVTVGQVGPPDKDFSGDFDYLQPSVTSGNSYVLPVNGTITSWSHNAALGPNQTLTMKVFRKVADPATYIAVGHDGPRPLSSGTLNTFPISMPVKAGDVLGVNLTSPVDTGAAFLIPGETLLTGTPGLGDGAQGTFAPHPFGGIRLNVTAEVQPTNSFTVGETKRNTNRGTASVTVNVPNSGELTASGNGVKAASAKTSEAVVTGAAKLVFKASGKKRRKLNQAGKVKLAPTITFTPTGGDPSTQSEKLKLIKR